MEDKNKKDLRFELGEPFENRWSPRSFDSDKPITKDDICTVFETARWAPSCFNDQPWRFIVCDKTTNPEAWNKALDCINEWNQGWCKNAPVLAIVCHDTIFDNNGKSNKWGAYDTGAATISAVYKAMQLGIFSHQMGGFDLDKTIEVFEIPDRYKPISVLAMGYKDTATKLDEKYKQSEISESERKYPESMIFDGKWEKGLY